MTFATEAHPALLIVVVVGVRGGLFAFLLPVRVHGDTCSGLCVFECVLVTMPRAPIDTAAG